MLWKTRKKSAESETPSAPASNVALDAPVAAVSAEVAGPSTNSGAPLAAESTSLVAAEAVPAIVAAAPEPAPAPAPTVVEVHVDEDQTELEFQQIKEDIHRQVISRIDLSFIGTMNDRELRNEVRRVAEQVLAKESSALTAEDRERLLSEVIAETFGLGPLEPLLKDPTVSDIMINGSSTVYVERRGKLQRTKVKFANDAHLLKIIQRIVNGVGRRIDETQPMCDARLQDGSRVNAIIPPLAIDGPLVSIRRFGSKPLQGDDLIRNESITREMLDFLEAAVKGRLNIIVSGGTGSGKTTLLNMLSGFIPDDERVATIEDAAELRLQQNHVIRMETRPANVEGHGEVSARDLVKNALRMRPDRIIIGECRGGETFDMLQAMNTGHDGSLTTIHANSPRDAMMRLEMMVGMSGFDLPMWTIRRQIASAVHLVVQAVRLTGGLRKIVRISEVTGMEGEVITMHDLFLYKQTGLDANRRAQGYFATSGVRPHSLERLEATGNSLPVSMFEQRILSCK
ncbi:MAG: CpaF family protein [Pirellulales bacterium]